jgi:Uma2 family endonuclease
MTVLPAWATDPTSLILTEESYAVLPDELRMSLEVIDGHVVFCRSGSVEHNVVARRLAQSLEAGRPKEPCTRVVTDFEMHYRKDRPNSPGFSFRRPDVALHRCFTEDRALSTADVLLVIEVVSPSSGYVDTVDKVAEYANEGIPIYLVVHLGADRRVKIIQEHHLDWASGTYRLVATHQDTLFLSDPFKVVVPFADLDAI